MSSHDTAIIRTTDGKWKHKLCSWSFNTRRAARAHARNTAPLDHSNHAVMKISQRVGAGDLTTVTGTAAKPAKLVRQKRRLLCRWGLHKWVVNRDTCHSEIRFSYDMTMHYHCDRGGCDAVRGLA